ncbi:MAG: hypothetical protein ACRDYV_03665 [Acidimicrobiia bacterium]
MAATKWILRPWERDLFTGCRRAWDLGARERQNWEPAAPSRPFSPGDALRDAMAVYYFPGMWSWSRAIVRPLATAGFVKAMVRQRDAYETAHGLSPEQERDYETTLAAGQALLEDYYDWAPEQDGQLTPLSVEALFDVPVIDPRQPDLGLLTPAGQGVDYRVRVDLAMVDNAGRNWVMDHRLVVGPWREVDLLLLDEQLLNRTWAWEHHFLAHARGTIHNELRLEGPFEADPDPSTRKRIRQVATPRFRRSTIRRGRPEIDSVGERLAAQVMQMSQPDVVCYPNPSARRCPPCDYRAPCLALQQGQDPGDVLALDYRKRTTPDFEPGRLGSVWGFVPHRIDERVRLNPPPPPPPAGAQPPAS